jgi:hypothetical protein
VSSDASTTYLLDIDVQLDKATGQLVNFRERSRAEMGAAAKGIETEMSRVESTAKRTMTETASSANKVAAGFRSVSPTIAAATNALTLMGTQAPPAIGAITRGVAGLAMTGFTPLGIAIGLATSALGFFLGRSQEAEKQALATAEANKKLAESMTLVSRAPDPTIAIGWAKWRQEKGLAGMPTGLAAAEEGLGQAEALLANRRTVMLGMEGHYDPRALSDLYRAVEARKQERDYQLELARASGYVTEEERKINALLADRATMRLRFGYGTDSDTLANALSGVSTFNPATMSVPGLPTAERAAELARIRGSLRAGESAAGAQGIAADYFSRLPDHPGFYGNQYPTTAAPVETPSLNRFAAARGEASMRELAKDTSTMRSFGERGAQSITSALNQSITSGDMDPFFSSLQSGITDAVLSAFTNALVQRPLESLLGNLTQNIGGFLGVGQSTDTYGGSNPGAAYADELAHLPASKSAKMSPKAVTLLIGDGASVNIGQGGGRGGSPARRPR